MKAWIAAGVVAVGVLGSGCGPSKELRQVRAEAKNLREQSDSLREEADGLRAENKKLKTRMGEMKRQLDEVTLERDDLMRQVERATAAPAPVKKGGRK